MIDFAPLFLGIVVTVSDTGSECNGDAVITNEELNIGMEIYFSEPDESNVSDDISEQYLWKI